MSWLEGPSGDAQQMQTAAGWVCVAAVAAAMSGEQADAWWLLIVWLMITVMWMHSWHRQWRVTVHDTSGSQEQS